jgi:hypothetical protein
VVVHSPSSDLLFQSEETVHRSFQACKCSGVDCSLIERGRNWKMIEGNVRLVNEQPAGRSDIIERNQAIIAAVIDYPRGAESSFAFVLHRHRHSSALQN